MKKDEGENLLEKMILQITKCLVTNIETNVIPVFRVLYEPSCHTNKNCDLYLLI